MIGLLGVYKKAEDAKSRFMDSYSRPESGGFMDSVQGIRNGLVQAKGDLVSQPMRDIGFGNADRIKARPVENFDSGQAANSGRMMQASLNSIGAYNPAAGMTNLGDLDLRLPSRAQYSPATNDGYMTPVERMTIEAEQAEQNEMMLLDNIGSKEYMPSPQGGALRMA
jgi:hypothetical protein